MSCYHQGSSAVEGLTKSRVTISKLIAGEYVFLVAVLGAHNEYQTKVSRLLYLMFYTLI